MGDTENKVRQRETPPAKHRKSASWRRRHLSYGEEKVTGQAHSDTDDGLWAAIRLV